jgi:hypothetical protein
MYLNAPLQSKTHGKIMNISFFEIPTSFYFIFCDTHQISQEKKKVKTNKINKNPSVVPLCNASGLEI